MNKTLFSLTLFSALAFTSKSQTIIDTVSVGAGYANQKWYSLQNDEQGTQSKDNWDIAFEINGYAASILGNVQKSNFAVYRAPYSVAQYSTIDTSGISSWPLLYNSDTTWTVGAFNKGAISSNPNDLGWGVYNSSTHIISGDSCFVIKLSASSYKKIKLIDLNGGVYSFEYANIDGANPQVQSITKSNYTGKNFAYFDLTNNVVVDREPISANWDLTFVKYMSFVPPSGTPYGVTGVLSNKGVTVAQADNVASPATYNSWTAHTFNTAINTIGYDWKEINMSTFAWDIKMDTVYFVKAKTGDIWKLRFTKFTGSSTGNFILYKEKLSSVGLQDLKGNISQVSLYPNPSTGNTTTLLFATETELSNVSVSIVDMTGRVVSTENTSVNTGLNKYELNTGSLNSGVYLIQLNAGTNTTTQKLIKQ
ncbi:MAG: T9SS type A sorting domain-containing protein [Bacteroidetes bacterium]|nr:T9SS type A sorting domain-containing protein [Bacteroidota bacterium]